MLDDKLNQIGFSASESRVYLQLLKLGSQAVSIIAKKLGMNRTTTYSVLRALEQKGVVSSCNNRGVKFFAANDPNCLVGYLDRRSRTIDYHRSEIISVISKFRSLGGVYDFKKPVVSFYDGIEGVKQVMYDALEAKSDYYAYLCIDKWFDLGLKDFLLEYKSMRIDGRQLVLKAIAYDTPEVREFFDGNYSQDTGMTQILYLPNNSYIGMSGNEMNIYDDKVAIIHLEKGDEFGVVIESHEIAAMQRDIFDMAWLGVKNGGRKITY